MAIRPSGNKTKWQLDQMGLDKMTIRKRLAEMGLAEMAIRQSDYLTKWQLEKMGLAKMVLEKNGN